MARFMAILVVAAAVVVTLPDADAGNCITIDDDAPPFVFVAPSECKVPPEVDIPPVPPVPDP